MNLIMRAREKETKKANPKKEGKMKSLPAILIGLLAYFAVGVSTGRGQVMYAPEPTAIATETPPTGVVETYKVVNGMNIRATVYNRRRRKKTSRGDRNSRRWLQFRRDADKHCPRAFAVWIHGRSD